MLEFFPNCLEEHASSSKPLVLVLDSLDQLSDDDAGRELDWLPKQLPDDVYIVLSTLPGDEYVCLPKLQVLNESNCSTRILKWPLCDKSEREPSSPNNRFFFFFYNAQNRAHSMYVWTSVVLLGVVV